MTDGKVAFQWNNLSQRYSLKILGMLELRAGNARIDEHKPNCPGFCFLGGFLHTKTRWFFAILRFF